MALPGKESGAPTTRGEARKAEKLNLDPLILFLRNAPAQVSQVCARPRETSASVSAATITSRAIQAGEW
jgi:hypothetical protein